MAKHHPSNGIAEEGAASASSSVDCRYNRRLLFLFESSAFVLLLRHRAPHSHFERCRSPSMPIYEYRCSACGHELEVLQKFADSPLVTCAKCGHATLTKLVSAAGFQLKGSGWYQTDFKGSGAKPAANGGNDAGKGDSPTNGSAATEAPKGDTAPSNAGKSDSVKSDGAKKDSAKNEGAKPGGKAAEASTKDGKSSPPTGADRSSS
ncbi:MAG: FmdB family zinc ribbon protein [Casimicrobiaceae bacterium]